MHHILIYKLYYGSLLSNLESNNRMLLQQDSANPYTHNRILFAYVFAIIWHPYIYEWNANIFEPAKLK